MSFIEDGEHAEPGSWAEGHCVLGLRSGLQGRFPLLLSLVTFKRTRILAISIRSAVGGAFPLVSLPVPKHLFLIEAQLRGFGFIFDILRAFWCMLFDCYLNRLERGQNTWNFYSFFSSFCFP